jgi:nucleoside-diphosphate-sugar epimerase
MALGRAAAFAQRMIAPEKAPVLSPFVVKILTRKVVYDSSKAARLLGWTPRVTASQGLREEARAFALRERQGA